MAQEKKDPAKRPSACKISARDRVIADLSAPAGPWSYQSSDSEMTVPWRTLSQPPPRFYNKIVDMPQPVKFVLFDISKSLVEKWREAFRELVPQECQEHIQIINSGLEGLDMSFDCIVSPANSFGRFDGG